MLVLSRKKNESIVINDDITIAVVEIRGEKVRLGIEAPREVPVHAREVYDAMKQKNPSLSGFLKHGIPCNAQVAEALCQLQKKIPNTSATEIVATILVAVTQRASNVSSLEELKALLA